MSTAFSILASFVMGKKHKPPATRIIHSTRNFLTIKEAAVQLGVGRNSLSPHLRRGGIKTFYKKGRTSPTGWTAYLREADVESFRKQPMPADPILISEAAKLLGVTRQSLTPYFKDGRLTRFRFQLGKGKHFGFILLERAQVEKVRQDRQHKTEKPLPPSMHEILKLGLPRPELIARLLSQKSERGSDARIARAVGVSKQRVGEIKRGLKP